MKRQGRARAAVVLALVVLSAFPFLQTLHFDLVWDDPALLAEVGSMAVSGGVRALFTSDFRVSHDQPLGYYRPVTTTSLWIQMRDAWRAHGADVPPETARSLHAFNLVVHLICTLLVWLLIRRFVRDEWVAALGAALFAVHPAHVEPVAFVSARTDLLVTVFVLGSLMCWMEMVRTTGRRRLIAMGAGSALALASSLAKEQALLLPVVLLAWALLLPPSGRADTRRTRLVGSTAWLLAVVLAIVMRVRAAGPGHALAPGLVSFARAGLPSLLLYLKLWVLPWPLNAYYTDYDLMVRWPAVVGCAVIVLMVVVAVRAGRGRAAAAASCFALIFLLPVLRLFPLAGAAAAERFLYLPSVGLALLTALALPAFERSRTSRIVSRGVVGTAIAVCLVLSTRGARPWASDATLYARMVQVSPHAAPAHRGLAENYALSGRYADAARECREAIRLAPGFADAYELLGVVSAKQGDRAGAHRAFDTALRLVPDRASIHANLGVLALNEGNLQGAIASFRRAAALAPQVADIHYRLGCLLVRAGDVNAARTEATLLDRLDPARARDLHQQIERAAQPHP